jgi:carbon storage regulator
MLVLSRKTKERIVIDESIEITIVAVHGGRVTLGIQAPMNVRIHRGELQPPMAGQTAAAGLEDALAEELG